MIIQESVLMKGRAVTAAELLSRCGFLQVLQKNGFQARRIEGSLARFRCRRITAEHIRRSAFETAEVRDMSIAGTRMDN